MSCNRLAQRICQPAMLLISLVGLGLSTPALAEAESSLVEQLERCAAQTDSLERLRCFDQLVAEHGIASSSATDGNAVSPGRAAFGLENRRAENAPDEITVTIVERWQGPRGAWRFRTDDGQEWHQVRADRRFQWNDDESYLIERRALGGFALKRMNSNRRTDITRVD